MDAHEAFDALVGALDPPMFIVTAAAGDEVAGCLVGFATQTSIDPPRFLACVSRTNRTFRVAQRATALGVHVVPAGRHDLAELFGGRTGDDVDKFARVGWREGAEGAPLLDDCPGRFVGRVLERLDLAGRFVGRVLERLDLGDHCGMLLEPVAAEVAPSLDALGFQSARGIEPGHPA